MTSPNHGNLAFNWTTTFFRKLQQLGVQHLVISPGSRSTPLTLAAAANDHFQKHVILDERSAAFTALGIGKATDTPAVLICTSGTALANYYPAVIEACQSGIPMILATADRPPNRRATGANQAIDQLKIFGDYPVFFHEVGEPRDSEEDISRLKIVAQQAFEFSKTKRGPVHLNFPFRKPLEPGIEFLQKIQDQNREPATSDEALYKETQHLPDQAIEKISEAQKPLIVVGPLAPGDDTHSIKKLATQLNCPVLIESTIDSVQVIKRFSGFLRNEHLISNLEPDLILRFGFQPTSKAIELGLNHWSPDNHYHFSSTDSWQDETFSGATHIPWYGRSISTAAFQLDRSDQWINKWKEVASKYQEYVDDHITNENTLTDGHIYHHLSPQITAEQFITVSNSFPARDINLFGKQPSSAPLFLNRGASGIDGLTSTALGISMSLNKAGVLFTGDLAFLHDSNALLNQQKIEHPLVIVVINNSGGSIFRMLPVERHEKYFEDYFETPQNADIKTLAAAHDIPCHTIDSLSSLHDFNLSEWMQINSGLSVVECKTDADASMKLRKKLWDYS
ncbi:2-succinyl-5-enolpyruvyl-6-hydroxy-3-cyclohexene-1-carboxylic-acid synthase [Fodinibius halophilus]|uniref:2-succinyl-5-enolpyruvyl-6-hydroxy-3-cyclohexene-1-carboxylate synthase n=1 Tax=Fodinibius halophilus TaxID=1736908 RepID=A0A6M1STI3_9BACT|nr:2-succinyl-5-enolpyruvyl-6-hydroxy-3-cyclohexene-1-carboxylic-acid synthase [Fodinibius halophilus]NGP86856.1 2-succinyl-5-enolpyruvyl-6-hydroxy-3-cyclohexene-1-carboxylic-acid synthase [Fodinibius halophilus]